MNYYVCTGVCYTEIPNSNGALNYMRLVQNLSLYCDLMIMMYIMLLILIAGVFLKSQLYTKIR